jgi:hypothetical protein
MPRLVDKIRRRAYRLARSGEFADCKEVERTLLEQGVANASRALLDPYVREHITACCDCYRLQVRERAAYHHELASQYLHV